MVHRSATAGFAVLIACATAAGQQMRQTYSGQLRTDPDVGTIQTVQREGRTLRIDPHEGEGHPLYVYPTGRAAAVRPGTGASTMSAIATSHGQTAQGQTTPSGQPEATPQSQSIEVRGNPAFVAPIMAPQPFDSTRGLRQPFEGVPAAPQFPGAVSFGQSDVPLDLPTFGPLAQVYSNVAGGATFALYHQPLIQIKVRVVEVGRSDTFESSSVLDYISHGGDLSLITTHNINNNRERTTGVSRFPSRDLLTVPANGQSIANLSGGAGGLLNLTSEHINWITSFLATELNADVITAPQVTTLNGQNVEFSAGTKQPFELGQSVIQNGSNVIQQFFYKHVGTYISVTPRIVDWGLHGEGKGNAAIVDAEVRDWNGLIKMMIQEGMAEAQKATWSDYVGNTSLVPFNIREGVLMRLNEFTRSDLMKFISTHPEYQGILHDLETGCPVCGGDGACRCNWKPEECTLDLEVVVRLSDAGIPPLTADRGGAISATTASVGVAGEVNVRAVANIVQIKSGHGVVMAGLIGEREVEQLTKVPILGDAPVVGYLFRSKSTDRQKTEVLIFIEATVLDSRPEVARAETANDFLLGQPHVLGELLDSPLEFGMYRAGFGTYLPPHSPQERVFWERLGRKVRKACTEFDDAVE
jgi:hypothetical protein